MEGPLTIKELVPVLTEAMDISFKKQFEVDIAFKGLVKWSAEKGPGKLRRFQLASVAMMNSPEMDFSLGLIFPKDCFLRYVSQIFGEEYKDIHEDIRDLCGEWLNLILGRAKGKLNDNLGCHFFNTIPMVVIGENLLLQTMGEHPLYLFVFDSDLGEFFLFFGEGKEGIIPWDDPLSSISGEKP